MKFGSILVLSCIAASASAQLRGGSNTRRRRLAVSDKKLSDFIDEIPSSTINKIKQRYLKQLPVSSYHEIRTEPVVVRIEDADADMSMSTSTSMSMSSTSMSMSMPMSMSMSMSMSM
mmetsp:Transcript_26953/g.56563  ORF Transcript_26953/g.56563 Transcript_26953/m.56563 type:complete len:117 (+) Transcript_26953:133-483(+)